MLLNRISVPLTFSWDAQSHAMPHHTCLREGVCNLCRLSKVELGCFHLCTALSNPEMTLFQLLWLVGSTKTMSGMFSGKPSKGKIKFKNPTVLFSPVTEESSFLHGNKSINHLALVNLKRGSRKRGEMPLFCLFF